LQTRINFTIYITCTTLENKKEYTVSTDNRHKRITASNISKGVHMSEHNAGWLTRI